MKTVTPTELRSNIFKLLDEILTTGVPLEVNKGGKKLRIAPVEKADKLQNLISRPYVIRGNPDDLFVVIFVTSKVNTDFHIQSTQA